MELLHGRGGQNIGSLWIIVHIEQLSLQQDQKFTLCSSPYPLRKRLFHICLGIKIFWVFTPEHFVLSHFFKGLWILFRHRKNRSVSRLPTPFLWCVSFINRDTILEVRNWDLAQTASEIWLLKLQYFVHMTAFKIAQNETSDMTQNAVNVN